MLDELFDLLNGIIGFMGASRSISQATGYSHLARPQQEDPDLIVQFRDCATAGLRIAEQISERNALADHAIRMRIGIGGGPIWMPVVGSDTAGWYAPLGPSSNRSPTP